MSTEPTRRLRRRKKLNVTAIKTTVVFFVGLVTALGGALTGLAPQTALAPSLRWMLGFSQEKAQGSALRFVCFTMVAALVGIAVGHHVDAMLLGYGLAAFVGATVGALAALPLTKQTALRGSRRVFVTLAMLFTAWIVTDAVRLSILRPHPVAPVGLLAIVAIGFGVGALTQAGTLPGGLLMVAGLYYLGHFSAVQAIATSLLVIVLAALLPAWGYGQRGLVDTDYAGAAITGGILGGIAGGFALAYADPKPVMIAFGLIAMFLCARELYRMTMLGPDEPAPPASPVPGELTG
jgi:uncharacterized membrane protein YfcA